MKPKHGDVLENSLKGYAPELPRQRRPAGPVGGARPRSRAHRSPEPVHDKHGVGSGNSRNGHHPKRLTVGNETMHIDGPSDRIGSFESRFVAQRRTRLPGPNKQVLSLYDLGLTRRDSRAHAEERYEVTVSPNLTGHVT